MPEGTCSIEGCPNPVKAKGLCGTHYAKQNPKQCTLDGCTEPLLAKGYCARHYSAYRRHGDPLADHRKVRQSCSVERCDEPRVSQGICSTHLARLKAHGDVDAATPIGGYERGPRCIEEGCDEPRLPTKRKRCITHDGPVKAANLRRKSMPGRNWSNAVVQDDTGLTLVATHADGRVFHIRFDPQDRWLIESRVWVVNRRGYAQSRAGCVGTQAVWLHRAILNMPEYDGTELVDHIDGDRLNNRRCNLRVVSKPINCTNTKIVNNRGTSRFRGVTWSTRAGKWRAQVVVNRHHNTIGYFATEEAAAEAVANWRGENGLPIGH